MPRRRQNRRRHRDARRRTVLGNRARRNVDVEIVLRQEIARDPEFLGTRPDVAQGRAGRLLHHVAELARENDVLVSAWKQGRFDEEDVAAGFRPGDAGRDARPRRAERDLFPEARGSEIGVNLVAIDDRRFRRSRIRRTRGDPSSHFPRKRSKLPLQVANAGLARVFGDHEPQRGVRDLHRA